MFQHDFGGCIEYGNYVKSKFPIFEGKSIFVQDHFSYLTDWEWVERHPGEEPRMAQVVDLKIDDKKLRILNYHGIWSQHKQDTHRTKAACQQLVQIASEVPYPILLCGDFNLFPDTESIQLVDNQFINLVDKFHIMSTRPKSNELSGVKRNVVDYIFVNKGITVEKFEVIDTDVSDHLPLSFRFRI
jgi:endonuclease/exonuclease/phosphatase family metal-dependent hydrolase